MANDGYLAIERSDSPILLVKPEVSLAEVLVLLRTAETAAQAERVVVNPSAQFFRQGFHSLVDAFRIG